MKKIRDIVRNAEFHDLPWRSLVKGLSALMCLLCVCLTFTALSTYYQNRFKRYDAGIKSVLSTMRLSSKQLRESAQRDIARGLQANRDHLISKRNAPESNGEYGDTYTRWGRRNCSGPNTTLVYSGIAAMTHYSHTGGGSNFLCLDLDVDYTIGSYVEGNQGSSNIYGVEYYDSSSIASLFEVDESTEGNSVYLHSVPCSVCMALNKGDHIMMPARGSCPDGWNLEYRGFIMSALHGDPHTSQYICIDDKPQVIPGTNGAQNAGRIRIVETQCNSLLCEPFVAGRELQCVVCSI